MRLLAIALICLIAVTGCKGRMGGERDIETVSALEPVSNEILFTRPPASEDEAALRTMIEGGGGTPTATYHAASNRVCTMLHAPSDAGPWLACRPERGGWVVRPALFDPDAALGTMK